MLQCSEREKSKKKEGNNITQKNNVVTYPIPMSPDVLVNLDNALAHSTKNEDNLLVTIF